MAEELTLVEQSGICESRQTHNLKWVTMAAAYIMVAAYNCIALLWIVFWVSILVLSSCQGAKAKVNLPPWVERRLSKVLVKASEDYS